MAGDVGALAAPLRFKNIASAFGMNFLWGRRSFINTSWKKALLTNLDLIVGWEFLFGAEILPLHTGYFYKMKYGTVSTRAIGSVLCSAGVTHLRALAVSLDESFAKHKRPNSQVSEYRASCSLQTVKPF